MSEKNYKELNLNEYIVKSLIAKGYEEFTDIQSKAIPHLLNGNDLIGIAQTGSGKTGAFSIPLIHRIADTKMKVRPFRTRVLVLCPTRELAAQIYDSFRDYGKGLAQKLVLITGGSARKKQIDTLMKGAEIVIATPGRLLDLINEEKLFLDQVESLVLDEADKMLDLGFIEDINNIADQITDKRQTILFSATMKKGIKELAQNLLSSPVEVSSEQKQTVSLNVEHVLYRIESNNKEKSLQSILKRKSVTKAIIFTNTKADAIKVSDFLNQVQLSCTLIHGDKNQGEREYAVRQFKKAKVRFLVATDIAARGIDIQDISHIINFDLPNNPESYVHRVGRTGRAQQRGKAISLFCVDIAADLHLLNGVESLLKQELILDSNHKFHKE